VGAIPKSSRMQGCSGILSPISLEIHGENFLKKKLDSVLISNSAVCGCDDRRNSKQNAKLSLR